MQIGHLDRMRNDGDGAAILFQSGHREADAFDRDRAFEDGVLLDVVRKFDVQPPVLRFIDALEADQLARSEEHTSELQSRFDLVCRLLLEKKKPTHSVSKARTHPIHQGKMTIHTHAILASSITRKRMNNLH